MIIVFGFQRGGGGRGSSSSECVCLPSDESWKVWNHKLQFHTMTKDHVCTRKSSSLEQLEAEIKSKSRFRGGIIHKSSKFLTIFTKKLSTQIVAHWIRYTNYLWKGQNLSCSPLFLPHMGCNINQGLAPQVCYWVVVLERPRVCTSPCFWHPVIDFQVLTYLSQSSSSSYFFLLLLLRFVHALKLSPLTFLQKKL